MAGTHNPAALDQEPPGNLHDRLFISVKEFAGIAGLDERTIRRAIEAGEIPGFRAGAKYLIPTAFVRSAAAEREHAQAAEPDLDLLAERVADRIFTRFAGLFGGLNRASSSGIPDET